MPGSEASVARPGGWAAGAGGLPRPEPHMLCACQAVESVQAEDESAQLCKRRIEHLKEHSSDQPAAAGLWKRKRMDRMMAEHLLRCGYYNTAVRLARQSGIEVGARVPTRSAAACPRGPLCSPRHMASTARAWGAPGTPGHWEPLREAWWPGGGGTRRPHCPSWSSRICPLALRPL